MFASRCLYWSALNELSKITRIETYKSKHPLLILRALNELSKITRIETKKQMLQRQYMTKLVILPETLNELSKITRIETLSLSRSHWCDTCSE